MPDLIKAQIQRYPFLRNYFRQTKDNRVEPSGKKPTGPAGNRSRPEPVGLRQNAPVSLPQNATAIEAKYEVHFTAFVDFLGFSEASAELDDQTRLAVLELLKALASLRSEFSAETIELPNGASTYKINPAVSTFSDNIVISYPLQSVSSRFGNERLTKLTILYQFHRLLSTIACDAVRIGFLIRGGATIGKLYHANGVIFGEALTEAADLERRTAIYPRVVLSSKITLNQDWASEGLFIRKDDDGIYQLDYISRMLFYSALPGDSWNANAKAWFESVVANVSANLTNLHRQGKLNELAKWTWFAKRFRSGLEGLGAAVTGAGISLDGLSSW